MIFQSHKADKGKKYKGSHKKSGHHGDHHSGEKGSTGHKHGEKGHTHKYGKGGVSILEKNTVKLILRGGGQIIMKQLQKYNTFSVLVLYFQIGFTL